MQESSTAQSELHSEDYNDFVTSIMAAEEDYPAESPGLNRQDSADSIFVGNGSGKQSAGPGRAVNDRSELFLPSESSQNEPNDMRTSMLGVPRTMSPDAGGSTSRPDPERLPSHNTLMREIGSMLGESKPISREEAASPPPDIPLKSRQRLERLDDGIAAAGKGRTYPPPQIRRKPVSRNSVSGDFSMLTSTPSAFAEKHALASSSTSTPATSPSSSIMDKLTPLTESLRSLSSRDYINVELDRPPVQPYNDTPPAYEPALSRIAPVRSNTLSRPRRRGTGGSSLALSMGSPIGQLVRENRLQDITSSLKDGYNVNETDPNTGITPIMEAARYKRPDAARLLLKSGAKLHVRDDDGNTPMHHAAREGDTEIIQMLLDGGGHAEDCNKLGLQPLQLAVAGGHTDTVLCLVNAVPFRKTNDEALVGAFLGAVKRGDTPTAQAVLAKGIKPKKMKEPWRLTCYAAQSGSLPMLELVLNEKASLKDRSPLGYSPLHFAAQHGQQPMVERLLSLKVPWKATTKKTGEVRC